MALPRRFELVYAPIVKTHLNWIEPKYYSLTAEAIEAQLRFEPDVETRNRKPLRRPVIYGVQWEMRLGPDNHFRAFYRVNRQVYQVEILAIGVKRGSRLLIGGEEIET